jgi:hypothetical protein
MPSMSYYPICVGSRLRMQTTYLDSVNILSKLETLKDTHMRHLMSALISFKEIILRLSFNNVA